MGTISNIQLEPVDVEWKSSGLGFCDGDISVNMEEQVVDVTAHQEGTNVLDAIRTGKSADVSMTLKEFDSDQIERIFAGAGGATDSTGSSGTDVIGWGSSKDFTQVTDQAGKLVLHPVTKGDSEYDRDLAFWNAYPLPDSITYSGENPQTVSVTFRCFPDTSQPSGIRLFGFGDHTQTF